MGARKPWSHDDLETARRMRAEGKSCREIGNAIGRGEDAVGARLRRGRPPGATDRHELVPVVAINTAPENGGYTRRQLEKQDDKFAAAMRRATGQEDT